MPTPDALRYSMHDEVHIYRSLCLSDDFDASLHSWIAGDFLLVFASILVVS